jgi:hypothetical protein
MAEAGTPTHDTGLLIIAYSAERPCQSQLSADSVLSARHGEQVLGSLWLAEDEAAVEIPAFPTNDARLTVSGLWDVAAQRVQLRATGGEEEYGFVTTNTRQGFSVMLSSPQKSPAPNACSIEQSADMPTSQAYFGVLRDRSPQALHRLCGGATMRIAGQFVDLR